MRAEHAFWILAPLLALALACAGPAAPPPPEDAYPHPELRACMGEPEVREYLRALRAKTRGLWELPEGAEPDQHVRVTFSLRRDGHLRSTVVADALTQEIEDSAVRALEEAAPFPPLEGPLACLDGMPFAAEFSNPPAPSLDRPLIEF